MKEKGFTVWITGGSSSGKINIASELEKELKAYEGDVEIIDDTESNEVQTSVKRIISYLEKNGHIHKPEIYSEKDKEILNKRLSDLGYL